MIDSAPADVLTDERILEIISGSPGIAGHISVARNGGFAVMNSSRALFGDIDARTEEWETIIERAEITAINEGLTFRIYRTYAGMRLIEIGQKHIAASDQTILLLRRLGCDDKFVICTQRDNNFRARLTPKPWRAEARQVYFGRPEVSPYDYLASPRWRTAEYISTIGLPVIDIDPDIDRIVEIHDQWCLSDRPDLPLA